MPHVNIGAGASADRSFVRWHQGRGHGRFVGFEPLTCFQGHPFDSHKTDEKLLTAPHSEYTKLSASTELMMPVKMHLNISQYSILTSYFIFEGGEGKAVKPPYWGGAPTTGRNFGAPPQTVYRHNQPLENLSLATFPVGTMSCSIST